MELLNPLQTQVIRFLRPEPSDGPFFPDIARAIRRRYSFVAGPETVADFDVSLDGVAFGHGHLQGSVIDSFKVYQEGIVAEARLSSEVIDGFLDDLQEFVSSEFGVKLGPGAGPKRLYVSRIEVRSDAPLTAALARLDPFFDALTVAVRSYGLNAQGYGLGGLTAVSDLSGEGQVKPGRFTFERRTGHLLSENVFFSEAPVSTAEHLSLLKTLEALL